MSRLYLTTERLYELARGLSNRELAVLRTLERVRLAGGSQLERLHFVGETPRARRRTLQSMTERRLVARLDRLIGGRRAGSAGFLYCLDIAGYRLLKHLSGAAVHRPTTPGGRFIRHILAVSELYVRLVEAEYDDLTNVLDFEAEPACWRRYPGSTGARLVAKPDAYVRLGNRDFEDHWFVEVDRATESPLTLATKCAVYRAYWAAGIEQAKTGVFPKVLWLVPTQRRFEVVIEVLSRLPRPSRQLHEVACYDDAVPLLTGGLA